MSTVCSPTFSGNAVKESGYYDAACKCCRGLEAAIKPVFMAGDEKYLFPGEDEEFLKDECLMLRVIRYRKSMAKSGGFDVECPPKYAHFNEVWPLEHLNYLSDLDNRVSKSAQFVIDTYNGMQSKKLELLGVSNVGASIAGRVVFFMTLDVFSPEKPDSYVENYQAVVSCVHRSSEKEIKIFRRKSDGKDHYTTEKSKLSAKAAGVLSDDGNVVQFALFQGTPKV